MLRNLKDKAIASVAKIIANKFFIGEFGEVTSIKIDSENKVINIELDLAGEKEKIDVSILGYEIIEKGGYSWLKFDELQISREWMNTLVNEVIIPKNYPDKLVKIDKSLGSLLKVLL